MYLVLQSHSLYATTAHRLFAVQSQRKYNTVWLSSPSQTYNNNTLYLLRLTKRIGLINTQ